MSNSLTEISTLAGLEKYVYALRRKHRTSDDVDITDIEKIFLHGSDLQKLAVSIHVRYPHDPSLTLHIAGVIIQAASWVEEGEVILAYKKTKTITL